ncbi:MAG: M1 family aminopeptidase [bacterium]|nr:M1 family aminopeptidase [bacterium]
MKQMMVYVLLVLAGQAWALPPRENKIPPKDPAKMFYRAKYDSSHEYDVKRYSLDIQLPMYNDSLYGRQTISEVQNASTDSIVLNSVRLDIDSVKLNGSFTGFATTPDTLFLAVDAAPVSPGQNFVLDIFYRGGDFNKNGGYAKGYYWFPQDHDGSTAHTNSYTMSEPWDARNWMPCFDEPWDKADSGCNIRVTAADSFTVAANGLLLDTVRSGDRLTWNWNEDSPIATYLMCFDVSRYAFWWDYAYLADGDTVPLAYFVWPGDSGQAAWVFSDVPSMVESYSRLFCKYPFSKYGMAAVYPCGFGGMEHQTMTTVHRSWVEHNVQEGIAHELAHMWFGDLVTCGTWKDMWLNEGFASYSEALYYEDDIGYPSGEYMEWYFSDALWGAALDYPIYDPPNELLFDWTMVYCKGAWVVQGLRGVMGDSSFFALLRTYCDSFAYGSVSTEDLKGTAEGIYGSSLGWFFDEWVHRAGHPIYSTVIYYKTRGDSNSAKVKINQTSTTGDIYKMPVTLSCSTQYGVKDTMVWDSVAVSEYYNVSDTLPLVQVLFDRQNRILKEYSDSLPYMTLAEVMSKNKAGPIMVHWNKFTADTTCAGYNLYRYDVIAAVFNRINQEIITDTVFTDTTVTSGQEYYYNVTAVNGADTCYETKGSNLLYCVTGVAGQPADEGQGIAALRLEQNAPNPFKQLTMIKYQLTRPGLATIKVYNVQGQLVKTLFNGAQTAGRHQAQWNGRDATGNSVSSGIYFARLEAEGSTITRTLQYIK